MSDTLFETDKYAVEVTDAALGEDGKYGVAGYKIINKDTGIVEHTTMMLPAAIFQAQHFSDTLKSLLETPEKATELSLVNDIIPDGVEPN